MSEHPSSKYLPALPALLVLGEVVPGVKDVLAEWRHPIAIVGAALTLLAWASPKLKKIYVAVLDIDNPKAGIAREMMIIRKELKDTEIGREQVVNLLQQLKHTHTEKLSTDDLFARMERGFGEINGALSKQTTDIRTIGDMQRAHTKEIQELSSSLDEHKTEVKKELEALADRIDTVERKVGT
jgi:hypothetical protein